MMNNKIKSFLGYVAVFCFVWIISSIISNAYIQSMNSAANARLNTRLIYAICKRFSNDERIDLVSTHGLATDLKNTKARHTLDVAYHQKLQQTKNKCPNAMNTAEKESAQL